MISFKEFVSLQESSDFSNFIAAGFKTTDLSDPAARDKVNSLLDQVTSRVFISPYIGFVNVSKVLALFNIWIRSDVVMDSESGDFIYAVLDNEKHDPFAKELPVGTTEAVETGVYVYFMYDMADDGFFDVSCAVLLEDELDDYIDEIEKDNGED